MLSRSLIKGYQVVQKEANPLVVDSNDLIARKIELLQGHVRKQGGFQSGLNAVEVEAVLLDEEMGIPEQEELPPQPVYTGPTPEELIAQAQAQIEEMKQTAMDEIESMKVYVLEESRQQGYREGQMQAVSELEKEKKLLQEKGRRLEQEYQDTISRLEPMFIDTLTGIYEQIFRVDLADYKPILLHAISASIRNIEGSREFLVHVSREDYDAVVAGKPELTASLGNTNAVFEVIEDLTLGPNQCMIETSSGIYDCGIGSQLEELGKRLRLLSYERQ